MESVRKHLKTISLLPAKLAQVCWLKLNKKLSQGVEEDLLRQITSVRPTPKSKFVFCNFNIRPILQNKTASWWFCCSPVWRNYEKRCGWEVCFAVSQCFLHFALSQSFVRFPLSQCFVRSALSQCVLCLFLCSALSFWVLPWSRNVENPLP